jgi:hypothetical protein
LPPVNIRAAPSLEWAVKNALSPSVSVIFFDDEVDDKQGGSARLGKSQLSYQQWLVVVSVRNVSDAGNAALQEVGVLLLAVLQALQGHKLSEEHLPLYRQPSYYRKTDLNGWSHYPLQFATGITLTARS